MNKLRLARMLYQLFRLMPKKHLVGQNSMVSAPFFIFGSGRNGSTLLNRMLNQHSDINLPSEQYFLGPTIFKYHLYNYMLWRDLVKVVIGELVESGGSHTWGDVPLPNLLSLYQLKKPDRTLRYLLEEMYSNAHSKMASRWGDTTPLNTYYLPEIVDTFPDAKYLFLLRDGRDVVASYVRGGSKDLGRLADPRAAARHWEHASQKYHWLKRRREVKMIRYEDLVDHPEAMLREICSYLGVGYESEMLQFHQHIPDRKMYQLAVHQGLSSPVFSTSVGTYDQVLTSDVLMEIEPILQAALKKFGYS